MCHICPLLLPPLPRPRRRSGWSGPTPKTLLEGYCGRVGPLAAASQGGASPSAVEPLAPRPPLFPAYEREREGDKDVDEAEGWVSATTSAVSALSGLRVQASSGEGNIGMV